MSQSATPNLPPLLGGYPIKEDLVPSIIFSALHVLLLPLFAYRLYWKSTRTTMLNAMLGLVIERSIAFGLRATISSELRSEKGLESSEGLIEYMQTTLFMGIIPISQDLAMLVRTMLVNSTYSTETAKEIPRLQEHLPPPESDETTRMSFWMRGTSDTVSLDTSRTKSAWSFSGTTMVEDWAEDIPDRPRMRFWIRRMHDMTTVVFIIIFATGLLGNCRLIVQRNNPTKVRENQILRYISSALSVLVLVGINSVLLWALQYIPRTNRQATKSVFLLSTFLLVPAVYRFTIMARRTASYYSYDSSAQNGARGKALFYVIGVLPEWLAVFICLCIDVRNVFRTGVDGDCCWWDETQDEKEKRLIKQQEKEIQKGDGLISVPVISKLSRGKFVKPLIS